MKLYIFVPISIDHFSILKFTVSSKHVTGDNVSNFKKGLSAVGIRKKIQLIELEKKKKLLDLGGQQLSL